MAVRPGRRRLVLSDVLVLVAATAIGLAPQAAAGERFTVGRIAPPLGPFAAPRPPLAALSPYLLVGFMHATPLLASWSVAMLLLGLRGPRPTLRRLALRPGFAVGIAALVALTVASLYGVAMHEGGRFGTFDILYFITSEMLITYAGWMIAGSWSILALAGRWRPGRTWVERLGWALGVAWLALLVLSLGRHFAIHLGWM